MNVQKKAAVTVVIPKGVFMSGALYIKPKVNIEMLEGSVLKGSTDIEDYPKAITRIEGHFEPWRAALLNADKADHLRITGKGTLDGNGKPFWIEFYSRRTADRTTTNLNVERPRLAFIQNSKDVQISGITFFKFGIFGTCICTATSRLRWMGAVLWLPVVKCPMIMPQVRMVLM